MASTFQQVDPPELPDWRRAGLCYFSRSYHDRQRFGHKVWRVTLDGGLSCPNRDGSLDTQGCVFCNPESFSPARRMRLGSISAQLDAGIRRLRARGRVEHFIAYFQPGTNTYGPVRRLRELYEEALAHPEVVGLAIGTRPDCAAEPVLDLLADLSHRTRLSVEYGLQTIHDRTLAWLNRGHRYADFLDAVRRSRSRGLEIGVHVILGLPGESRTDMSATAGEIARLGIAAVKLHNLCAVRGTRLAEWVAGGQVRLPELPEYVGMVVDFLERLPPECVVDRLSGDAPPEYLLAPRWCLEKSAVRMAIEAEFRRRGTWQGSRRGTVPIFVAGGHKNGTVPLDAARRQP